MKAEIVDAAALSAIGPSALASYVRGEGWERVEAFGELSDVYALAGFSELILPRTDTLGDYPTIVSDLLKRLAAHEGRDQLQVYRDLVGAERDVVRVRVPHAEDDGSVRVDDGVEIVLQARDMLLSAACSANDPRESYRAGKVKEASGYMDRVRLGQTEHGSFIVTLLAPVPPSLTVSQLDLWPSEASEPYERLVTRRLADGLGAARLAAEKVVQGADLSAFEQVVPRGVSANLCEALAKLIVRGEGLDVSITWAKTRPTPETRRTVSFTKPYAEILSEAARLFRSQEPRPEERLEGFVVKLDRGPDIKEGKVTLRTLLDGSPVSVRTELEPHLYSVALSAHEQQKPLRLLGDLKRVGQRWRLDSPRGLTILEEPDEPVAEEGA